VGSNTERLLWNFANGIRVMAKVDDGRGEPDAAVRQLEAAVAALARALDKLRAADLQKSKKK
jgi:hypothetical protein